MCFPMQSMIKCFNVTGGPDDGDDPRNINIPETKGIRDFAALDVLTNPMNQPLKIRKVKIGTKANPKFVNVGDY